MPGTLHEQALDTLQKRIEGALGKELIAQVNCKEYHETHSFDLVRDVASVRRNLTLPGCRPDLVLLNEEGEVLSLVEVVVSHAPERNVHRYAIEHGLQIVEFHLPPPQETDYWGRKTRKTSDEAVLIKRALENFRSGPLLVDDHNLLCQRPRCDSNHPLPLRTVHVQVKDCWKCDKALKVAVGIKDEEHLYPDDFTPDEREFAQQNGVILQTRFSATARQRYLANVCGECDQIQGQFYLFMDPYHDEYRYGVVERKEYGPCDECARRYCQIPDHGEYIDHEDRGCPVCRYLAESVMCHHRQDRECFYPDTCQEQGCYFERREASQRAAALEYDRARQQEEARRRQLQEQKESEWADLKDWFRERTQESAGADPQGAEG